MSTTSSGLPEDVDLSQRFGFGRNWSQFVKKNFSQERLDQARNHMAGFLQTNDLSEHEFLDIGSGSGLHSMAACQLGAERIHSLDYDPNSVATTRLLRERAGSPAHWHVERGDALDKEYIAGLGKFSLVYSWGVLHHTGSVWEAVHNASTTVADGGLFYLALYAADVQTEPDFWLDVKQRYVASSRVGRELMAAWYVGRFELNWRLRNVPRLLKKVADYRFSRGMSYMTDVRDWLGGWPMEFVYDQDVIDFLAERCFRLERIATGEANTEFLFRHVPGADPVELKAAAADVAACAPPVDRPGVSRPPRP